MPCATRNELDLEDAKSLPGNGVMVVCARANKPLTAEDPADLTGPGAPIRLLEDPQLVLRSELAAPGSGHHLRIRRSRVHGGGLGRGEPSRQLNESDRVSCSRTLHQLVCRCRELQAVCHPTSMTIRQWSLGPHSSGSLSARTCTASAMPLDAKT